MGFIIVFSRRLMVCTAYMLVLRFFPDANVL